MWLKASDQPFSEVIQSTALRIVAAKDDSKGRRRSNPRQLRPRRHNPLFIIQLKKAKSVAVLAIMARVGDTANCASSLPQSPTGVAGHIVDWLLFTFYLSSMLLLERGY